MEKLEVPSLGESITEAELTKWLVTEGQYVKVDQPVCELETDKATVDVPAPTAGKIHFEIQEGETVNVGEAIANIDTSASPDAAEPAADKPADSTQSAGTASAAPAAGQSNGPSNAPSEEEAAALRSSVLRLIKEHNLDPSQIKGTGPRGHVTKNDVTNYIELQNHNASKGNEQVESTTKSNKPAPIVLPARVGSEGFDEKGVKLVPMSRIRKKIAERMVTAQSEAAMLTTFNEIDMSAVMDLRKKYKERFQELHNVSLGFMSFFAKAVCLGLHEFPVVNAYIKDDHIEYHEAVHLGVAVSTDRGLIVPVLKNADQMGFAQIESEIKRMAISARDGKLGLDEMSGGTFTITNGGIFGSLMSTPILNYPQSGILGMHAIQKRPKVMPDDSIVARPMMYVALSYDHRLVDGKDSVSFLVRVKEYLEDPERLMLQV